MKFLFAFFISFLFFSNNINSQNDTLQSSLDKIIEKVLRKNNNTSTKEDVTSSVQNTENEIDSLLKFSLLKSIYICYPTSLKPSSIRNVKTNEIFLGVHVGNKLIVSNEILDGILPKESNKKTSKSNETKNKNNYDISVESYLGLSKNQNFNFKTQENELISTQQSTKSLIGHSKENSVQTFYILYFNDKGSYDLSLKQIITSKEKLLENKEFKMGGLVFTLESNIGYLNFNFFGQIKRSGVIKQYNESSPNKSKSTKK